MGRQMFALSRTKTKEWKVGEGWLYCGLKKVDVESTTLPASASSVYLNVSESEGEFSAALSGQEDKSAIVSILLYKFKEGKVKMDGRNVIFVPLYN